MTDRQLRAAASGDLAGAGCLVIIGLWGWPAVAVLAAILEQSP